MLKYIRMKIIEDFLEGKNLTEISNKENYSIKTVKLWIDRYKDYSEKELNKE